MVQSNGRIMFENDWLTQSVFQPCLKVELHWTAELKADCCKEDGDATLFKYGHNSNIMQDHLSKNKITSALKMWQSFSIINEKGRDSVRGSNAVQQIVCFYTVTKIQRQKGAD